MDIRAQGENGPAKNFLNGFTSFIKVRSKLPGPSVFPVFSSELIDDNNNPNKESSEVKESNVNSISNSKQSTYEKIDVISEKQQMKDFSQPPKVIPRLFHICDLRIFVKLILSDICVVWCAALTFVYICIYFFIIFFAFHLHCTFQGLVNLGNTCFFNSIIQCILFTHPIEFYIEKVGKRKFIKVPSFADAAGQANAKIYSSHVSQIKHDELNY